MVWVSLRMHSQSVPISKFYNQRFKCFRIGDTDERGHFKQDFYVCQDTDCNREVSRRNGSTTVKKVTG